MHTDRADMQFKVVFFVALISVHHLNHIHIPCPELSCPFLRFSDRLYATTAIQILRIAYVSFGNIHNS